MTKILITGGAGFIGSHLTDELLQHGYTVRILDNLHPQVHGASRRRPEYLDPEAELVVGDVGIVRQGFNRMSITRTNGRHSEEPSGETDAAAAPSKGASTSDKISDSRPVLITGGSGFIGTNLAHRLLASGKRVILYDNLSRPGVERNARWLRANYGQAVTLVRADVCDAATLRRYVAQASAVYHFAAQVAVTTSLDDPIHDFELNARGTLNLLEALRALIEPPPLLFTSTNKVYGDLRDVPLAPTASRYEPGDERLRTRGFDESWPLIFHSPYGCSKGAAGQYVQDYSRTFHLKTVVFRMSCIYGPHQFGTEDQGWVAHFLIQALRGQPITLYGDGKQVRDVLFVEDLVDALLAAIENAEQISGHAFNLGGGPENTTSLLELIDLIGELHRAKPKVNFAPWRPADQQYYVSDTRQFSARTGWRPKVPMRAGIAKLYHWLQEFGDAIPPALSGGRRRPVRPIRALLPKVHSLRSLSGRTPRRGHINGRRIVHPKGKSKLAGVT